MHWLVLFAFGFAFVVVALPCLIVIRIKHITKYALC